jgi:hypothetical protein
MAPKKKAKGKAADAKKAAPATPASKVQIKADFHHPVVEMSDFAIVENICLEIVDEIIDLSGEALVNSTLQKKLVPYTARRALNDVIAILKWNYLPCDIGEAGGSKCSSWNAEPEPKPSPLDCWARGRIPTKKRPPRFNKNRSEADLESYSLFIIILQFIFFKAEIYCNRSAESCFEGYG